MERKSAETLETTRREMKTEVKTEEIKTNQLAISKASGAKQVNKLLVKIQTKLGYYSEKTTAYAWKHGSYELDQQKREAYHGLGKCFP